MNYSTVHAQQMWKSTKPPSSFYLEIILMSYLDLELKFMSKHESIMVLLLEGCPSYLLSIHNSCRIYHFSYVCACHILVIVMHAVSDILFPEGGLLDLYTRLNSWYTSIIVYPRRHYVCFDYEILLFCRKDNNESIYYWCWVGMTQASCVFN